MCKYRLHTEGEVNNHRDNSNWIFMLAILVFASVSPKVQEYA